MQNINITSQWNLKSFQRSTVRRPFFAAVIHYNQAIVSVFFIILIDPNHNFYHNFDKF